MYCSQHWFGATQWKGHSLLVDLEARTSNRKRYRFIADNRLVYNYLPSAANFGGVFQPGEALKAIKNSSGCPESGHFLWGHFSDRATAQIPKPRWDSTIWSVRPSSVWIGPVWSWSYPRHETQSALSARHQRVRLEVSSTGVDVQRADASTNQHWRAGSRVYQGIAIAHQPLPIPEAGGYTPFRQRTWVKRPGAVFENQPRKWKDKQWKQKISKISMNSHRYSRAFSSTVCTLPIGIVFHPV